MKKLWHYITKRKVDRFKAFCYFAAFWVLLYAAICVYNLNSDNL